LHEKILILDFGAQYTQLIARRVREARVYCEIHPHDVADDFVRGFGASGIAAGSSMCRPMSSAPAPPLLVITITATWRDGASPRNVR